MLNILDTGRGPLLRRLVTAPDRKAAGQAMHRGDWATAAKLWKRVLDRDPKRAAIWVQYGHALKEQGDFGRAEGAYREALQLEPRNADTHLQLGHLLKISGRFEQAAATYSTSAEMNPDQHEAIQELRALPRRFDREPTRRHPIPSPVNNATRGSAQGFAFGPLGNRYADLIEFIGSTAPSDGWIEHISASSIAGYLARNHVENNCKVSVSVNDGEPAAIKLTSILTDQDSRNRFALAPFHIQTQRLLSGHGDAQRVAVFVNEKPLAPTPAYVYSDRLNRRSSQIDLAGLRLRDFLESPLFL